MTVISHDIASLPPLCVAIALAQESAGVFEAAGVPVLYCGVGKINATLALTRELERYRSQGAAMPVVVNFGSAGSRGLARGSLVACHEFVQRDMDVRGLGFDLGVTPFDAMPATLRFAPAFTHLATGVCGSGDSFSMLECEVPCDVVDMEGYALAKVCRHYGASLACAKYVTDGAGEAAAGEWRDNVHRAAEQFLALYRSLLQGGISSSR